MLVHEIAYKTDFVKQPAYIVKPNSQFVSI